MRASQLDPTDTTRASENAVRKWLAQLPKPIGVLVHTDAWGVWLSEVCRQRYKEHVTVGDLTMTQIASESGFSSGKQLSHVFHKEVGVTPTSHRRRATAPPSG